MIFGKIKKTMEKNNKLNSPISDLEIIEKLLPHRKPMIMVDGLHFFSEKKAISKLTIVKENIFVTNGYFSETGLLEHMAQTAALHIGYKQFLNCSKVKEGFIGAIKSSKIISLAKVSETISTEVEIIYDVGNMTMVKIKSYIDDNIIGNSEMSTVLKSLKDE